LAIYQLLLGTVEGSETEERGKVDITDATCGSGGEGKPIKLIILC